MPRPTTRADRHEPSPHQAQATCPAIVALDAINDAYLSFDHDWCFTYLNASAERFVQIDRDSLIGRCVWDVFPALVDTTLYDSYLRAVRDRAEVQFEWYATTVPGWFDVRAAPSDHGLTVVYRDITQRKVVEAELERTDRHFRTIVERIDAATYRHAIVPGSNEMSTYMSPQIERITGYPASSWARDREFGLSIVHPDDRDRVRQTITDSIRHDHGLEIEYRYIRPDGEIVWARNVGSFASDDRGSRIWQGIILDISEKKRSEDRLRESEAHYRSIWEHAPIGISAAGPDGHFRYANPALASLLGYSVAELQSMSIDDLTHPDDRDASIERREAMAEGCEGSYSIDKRYLRKDGTVIWCKIAVSIVRDTSGRVEQTIAMIEDVTERITSRDRLLKAEARYRSLVEQIPAAVYTTQPYAPDDDHTPTTYISPHMEVLTGYPVENWLTYPDFTSRIVHPDDIERRIAEIKRCEQSGKNFRVDYRIVHRDGHIVWLRNESTLIHDDDGNPLFWQGIIIDISEQQELQRALQYQAMHDVLTGLPNRALLRDRTRQALAQRRRTARKVALLFLDLDNFKVINDSLGHAAGDDFLRAVAERLRRCVREEDTVARLGGDEFAILLTRLSDVDGVLEVVQRIAETFRTPLHIQGRSITAATSIGIASATDSDEPDDLLRKADLAMYRAKAQGKNRYALYDAGMHAEAVNRLDLEHDLRRAIEQGELTLHYQPQVSLPDGEIIGMEALVRWDHPERGLLPPSAFIPIAEESGLIVPLGGWVLRTACEQQHAWSQHVPWPDTIKMCVNLSAREFRQPGLVDEIQRVLAETQFDPSRLVVEITETAVMDDASEAVERLRAINALGVRFSIDDFGLGYSSLAYLKRFPVDVVKIDRTFISGLGTSDEDTAIVAAIISLAHTLGLTVVAEGVETADQIALLMELGCDRAQGYYFSTPVPAEQIMALVSDRTGLVPAE